MTARPCLVCGTPANGSHCPAHKPAPWSTSTRRRRLPRDWKQRRAAVLRRDRGICHVCGNAGADEVDHIVAGDNHALSNLGAIHRRPCHERKTLAEASAGRAAARTGGR